jgi:hypothetical protein
VKLSLIDGGIVMGRSRLEEFFIYVCVVLFLSSFVTLACIFECAGQAGSATAAVSPSSITVSVGQSFSVDIDISSVSDLYGWEFYLGWNSSLLSFVGVNEGPFLKSGGNTFFTYYLNTTGEHVVVDCTLEGEISGVSGDGVLATVTLNTTNVGECPLNLYDVSLISSSEQQIPSKGISGYGYFTSQQLHDVVVAQVTASPTTLIAGGIVNINVTVQDEGAFAEVFNVTANANSQAIGQQPAALDIGSSATLTFTWNTSNSEKGEYNISASFSLHSGEVNAGNSTGTANTPVTILVQGHDIAITSLTPSKTVAGEGYSMNITATLKNYGTFSETFNITVYANTTSIASQTVTLPSANSTNMIFTWNTTSFSHGTYTLNAATDTGNSTLTSGSVTITIPGDINADGTVNILDGITLSNAFYATPGSSNWNPNADINGDGVVNILDAIILGNHFGQKS